jgi:hypothetical protein
MQRNAGARTMTIERTIPDQSLLDALERINSNHGRGRVVGYTLDPDDESGRTTGRAHRRIPTTQRTGLIESRRFRVVGRTVHFLGHQRKLEG